MSSYSKMKGVASGNGLSIRESHLQAALKDPKIQPIAENLEASENSEGVTASEDYPESEDEDDDDEDLGRSDNEIDLADVAVNSKTSESKD